MTRARLALLVVILAFCAPMFAEPLGIASGDAWRDNDWLNNRVFDVLARDAILEHGELPLRSPMLGGGFPTIAHPSDGSWAPTLVAVLLFGDVLGVKLNLILLLLAGAWGMHGLARRWLGLAEGPALGAAAAFALSGWLPSTLLVGFYPQALLLLTPAILHLLLGQGLRARLGAGMLLFFVLQQAGNGFAALGFFLVAFLAVDAASHRDAARARRLGSTLLAAGAVAALLGLGKLVPLAELVERGTYAHADFEPLGARQAPPPGAGAHTAPPPDADYYDGPAELLRGLLRRAPAEAQYLPYPAPPAGVLVEERPHGLAVDEFGHLGLTPTLLLLALLGLLAGRRAIAPAALAVWFAAICLGPHNVIDLHAFGPGALPGLRDLSQPLKYYDIFVLIPLCGLVGLGLEQLARRWPKGRRTLGALLAAALFLPPFLANRGAFGERFALPVEASPAASFHQIAQLGHPSWLELPPAEQERRRAATFLREFARPPRATEYVNGKRGIGTLDWYGTLRLPESAVPARFVTPSGRELANPRYRGEAWLQPGEGEIAAVDSRPNEILVDAITAGDATLVVNQSWLPGFEATGGTLLGGDLLTVRLSGAGRHAVRLAYRPSATRWALGGSALAFLAWLAAFAATSKGRSAREDPATPS